MKTKSNNTVSIASILMVMAILVSGCGDSTGPDMDNDDNGNDEPAANEVWLVNHNFTPSNRAVAAGTTVTWVNHDNETHTVTSGTRNDPNDLFNASLNQGQEFQYTFEEAGTYPYHCLPHDNMSGTITVSNGDDNGGGDDNGDNGGYDDENNNGY